MGTARKRLLRRPPLIVVGLAGGIASGKSTVAAMFAELGATVISADAEGRAVVEPGEPALAEIVAEFGSEYLLPDGRLDRRKLGARVFGDPPALKALNRMTHPRIRRRLEARMEALQKDPPDPPVVVLEAAILVEAGWKNVVDRLVVVAVQPSTQVARLIAGFSLSEREAWARVEAQMPAEARRKQAHYSLDGERPLTTLRNDVAAIWHHLSRL